MFVLLLTIANCIVYFRHSFQADYDNYWNISQNSSDNASLTIDSSPWNENYTEMHGLKINGNNVTAYLSSLLKPFSNYDKILYIQFIASFYEKPNCASLSIKLLPNNFKPQTFSKDTEYLFNIETNLCKNKLFIEFLYNSKLYEGKISDSPPNNRIMNLYTFVLYPDNTYSTYIDEQVINDGGLYNEFTMHLGKHYRDPSSQEPPCWNDPDRVEEMKNISHFIIDQRTKPSDWNPAIDGAWEPIIKKNPLYYSEDELVVLCKPKNSPWLGKFLINYDYKPETDLYQFDSIGGVGLTLSQGKESGVVIKAIQISDSDDDVNQFAYEWEANVDRELFRLKKYKEANSKQFSSDYGAFKEKQEL